MDVLILGASVRAAACSAARAGFRPFGIDLFADGDLAAVGPALRVEPQSYPEGLEALSLQAPPGPWLYTGALENAPELIDRIAARRPLWGNPGSVLSGVRDPFAVSDCLAREGLPCPAVRRVPEGLPRDATWLVKPWASGGGLGIEPLGHGAVDPARRTYYQERIPGTSLSAIFVGNRRGARLAGMTRQLLGRPGAEFAYVGSVGPWPVSPVERARIERLGTILARSFGLSGLFGVDLILSDGVPWPVEVNPRYSASVEVLELASGQPLLAAHRLACESGVVAPAVGSRGEPERFVGKRIVFAPGPGRFRRSIVRRAFAPGQRLSARLADVPAAGTPFDGGEPVLTVLECGTTLEDCLERLERRAARWERRLGLWDEEPE